jgi:hypothetical protein
MEFSNGNADAGLESARQRLKNVRQLLLDLHKALLDSERTQYEIIHGPLASPAAFLQLLIHDERFAWLRPVTTLIVQIDEGLAAKKPPAAQVDIERLITDTRAFFSPSRDQDGFWRRYAAVVQRDPAVAQLQREMEQALTNHHL